MPTVLSCNEWDPLLEIVVGSATGARWPIEDPVFGQQMLTSSWPHSRITRDHIPDWVIDQANEDLESLCDILRQAGVRVHRPHETDFTSTGGMYNYCPRDRVIIADDVAVDVNMMYPCRDQEIDYLASALSGAELIRMPRDPDMVLDAANVSRLGDDWLFLISGSGTRAAWRWLCDTFPQKRIHLCDFYAGVHIDSTIAPLREGTVLLNAGRVNEDNLPAVLRSWDKIWIDRCEPREFYHYPYASDWIGLNVLSIDPHTVIVDSIQTSLIHTLESHGFTVVPTPMRQSRTLGGGLHCVTLDIRRQHV
jgi:scyllo-inosamine-4-phosphate amidinotransferase 1